MDNAIILEKIKQYVFHLFIHEHTGHDVYHIQRVVANASKIQEQEGGDVFIIKSSAWLHDCWDDKLFTHPEQKKEKSIHFMTQTGIEDDVIQQIVKVIKEVSFRKNKDKTPGSLEAKIVQDADRLDALGAIGIARAFAYGGSKNRMLYNPQSATNEDTISHFYEKLFLLKDLMHTATARNIAIEREIFIKKFITQFYKEWNE